MVARLDVGFVCWALHLARWSETRHLYVAQRVIEQLDWTTGPVAALVDLCGILSS